MVFAYGRKYIRLAYSLIKRFRIQDAFILYSVKCRHISSGCGVLNILYSIFSEYLKFPVLYPVDCSDYSAQPFFFITILTIETGVPRVHSLFAPSNSKPYW